MSTTLLIFIVMLGVIALSTIIFLLLLSLILFLNKLGDDKNEK